jgi:CheY-like chemotaxis protein
MSKILIIENTALTALRLRMELEQAGYIITDTCATADEAIKSIIQTPPDVVLLDFHLDKNTQGDTVAHFLNDNYNIPIIYLSQYADDKTIESVSRTQFYAYLTKPFLPNALVLTVRQALKYQKEQSQPILEKVTFVFEHIEHTILASEILWINTKPATKGIFITTRQAEEQFRVYETLKDFLNTRSLTTFVQISSSYILNFDYVTDIIGKNKFIIAPNNLPKKRQITLDDSNRGRFFKIGKTFKQSMTNWVKQWNVK